METRSCEKESNTLQFVFLKTALAAEQKRDCKVAEWKEGSQVAVTEAQARGNADQIRGGGYKLKDKGTDFRYLLDNRTCW